MLPDMVAYNKIPAPRRLMTVSSLLTWLTQADISKTNQKPIPTSKEVATKSVSVAENAQNLKYTYFKSYFYFIKLLHFVYLFVQMCTCVCVDRHSIQMKQSENNLRKLVLSFHAMRARDSTQIIRLGGRGLYPLSDLASFKLHFKSFD